jgi:transposase
LPTLLKKGAEHFGFRGEVWTRARVGEVIRRSFGVKYHDSHVGRLLKAIGWTRQTPIRRATERNEAEIEHWIKEEWPRIKKKPQTSSAP